MKRRQKVYHRKKWYFLLVVDLELEPVHCCYYAYGRNCTTVHVLYNTAVTVIVERLCVTIN